MKNLKVFLFTTIASLTLIASANAEFTCSCGNIEVQTSPAGKNYWAAKLYIGSTESSLRAQQGYIVSPISEQDVLNMCSQLSFSNGKCSI